MRRSLTLRHPRLERETEGESELGSHLHILSNGGKDWPQLSESQRVSFCVLFCFPAEAWVAVGVSWRKKGTSLRTHATDWKGNYSSIHPFLKSWLVAAEHAQKVAAALSGLGEPCAFRREPRAAPPQLWHEGRVGSLRTFPLRYSIHRPHGIQLVSHLSSL